MKALTRVRVNRVKEELLTGVPVSKIVSKLSCEFGIVPRSLDYIITKAHREMKAEWMQENMIRQQIKAAQIEQRAGNKMTVEGEVDTFLTELIKGKRPDERVVSTAAGPKVVQVAVRAPVILKALELFYSRIEKNKK